MLLVYSSAWHTQTVPEVSSSWPLHPISLSFSASQHQPITSTSSKIPFRTSVTVPHGSLHTLRWSSGKNTFRTWNTFFRLRWHLRKSYLLYTQQWQSQTGHCVIEQWTGGNRHFSSSTPHRFSKSFQIKSSNVFHTKLPQEKQGGWIGAVFRMEDGHWESSLKSYVVQHLHKLAGKEVSKTWWITQDDQN